MSTEREMTLDEYVNQLGHHRAVRELAKLRARVAELESAAVAVQDGPVMPEVIPSECKRLIEVCVMHETDNEISQGGITDLWYDIRNHLATRHSAPADDVARDAEIARIADAMESVAGPGAPYASASVPRYAVLGWVEQIRALLAASKQQEKKP